MRKATTKGRTTSRLQPSDVLAAGPKTVDALREPARNEVVPALLGYVGEGRTVEDVLAWGIRSLPTPRGAMGGKPDEKHLRGYLTWCFREGFLHRVA